MIFKKLYKNYWKFGFKSYLYDLLTPSAYSASLQSVSETVDATPKDIVLDVGCGTGQILRFLSSDIENGLRYIGLDQLEDGLNRTKSKANSLRIGKNTFCIQADFRQGIPIKKESVDFIICHFASYIIRDVDIRINLMVSFWETLKPGGKLVIANPSKNYAPDSIIRESVSLDKNIKNIFERLIRKCIVNPLAKFLGLDYILSQLKNGEWKWFSYKEIIDEITKAGFEVSSVKEVYGQSGYLAIAKKPSL